MNISTNNMHNQNITSLHLTCMFSVCITGRVLKQYITCTASQNCKNCCSDTFIHSEFDSSMGTKVMVTSECTLYSCLYIFRASQLKEAKGRGHPQSSALVMSDDWGWGEKRRKKRHNLYNCSGYMKDITSHWRKLDSKDSVLSERSGLAD